MSCTVEELIEWLSDLDMDWEVGIDEEGTILRIVQSPNYYYEIGGIPEEEDED